MPRHIPSENCAPDCFGCKIQSVSLAPSATPTRSNAGVINFETKKSHADVAAYKRLRKDGVQPKSVKGSAELEARATSKWEIETGQRLGGNAKLGERFDKAQAAVSKGETI